MAGALRQFVPLASKKVCLHPRAWQGFSRVFALETGRTAGRVSANEAPLAPAPEQGLATLPVRLLPRATSSSSPEWSAGEALAVLQQVAAEGVLEPEALARLHGEDSSSCADGEQAGDCLVCGVTEFVLAAEACCRSRTRDFVLLAALAERLVPELHRAPLDALVRLCTAYASLGALNDPLFRAAAASLLGAWPERGAAPGPPPVGQLAQVARAFAAQRMRHEELFDRIARLLRAGEASAGPPEALSLLHSLALLRLDAELGDLWGELEGLATAPGLEGLAPGALAALCHALFLSRRAEGRLEDVGRILAALAPPVLALEPGFWATAEGSALRLRLLLLRSALRYLHHGAYRALPREVSGALRHVHRLELPRSPRPAASFARKLSAVLTKMKIGHVCSADRGPFVLDVVERDRKVVYECNHFDRFYAGTIEKVASMCLQERIVKAMGYRVVQIPHWQWNKIKHRRQRIEYIRMSRYYAIKDRREFAPRDEVPQDLASNELDHLGEFFFRKDLPSSSWSWFSPRYDANQRLPQHWR